MKLFFFLFLSLSILVISGIKLSTNKKTKTGEWIVVADAGSTGTRFFFHEKTTGVSQTAKCSLKPEHSRLGEAILKAAGLASSPKVKDEEKITVKQYADVVTTALKTFVDGTTECGGAHAGATFSVYIYSTAGSRGTLNQSPTSLETFKTALAPEITTYKGTKGLTISIVDVNVMSGRMEGLLGYVSALLKTSNHKQIYYEIGGASTQIVWAEPADKASSSFNVVRYKSKSEGPIHLTRSKGFDEMPEYIYSRSFLGNGGEKCVEEAWSAISTGCNSEANENAKFECVVNQVILKMFHYTPDQTNADQAVDREYAAQWDHVFQKYLSDYPDTATDRSTFPDTFAVNSKGIACLLYRHQNSWTTTAKDACKDATEKSFPYTDLNTYNAAIWPAINAVLTDTAKQDDFSKQGVCVGLQVRALLRLLKLGETKVSIYFDDAYSWTKGASYFLSKGVNPFTFFDRYTTTNTNTEENKALTLPQA